MSASSGPPAHVRAPTVPLLAAYLLLGLSQIAILPPFEGFDENAHLSVIEQIAYTGAIPRSTDTLSSETTTYPTIAPAPPSLSPRFSYGTFATAPPAAKARANQAIHSPAPPYRTSNVPNWETQQPPLYYALLAPLSRVLGPRGLAIRLLTLRAASFLLAWLALALTTATTLPGIPRLAVLLWPLLLPMWLSDTARLGNDSLAMLIAATTAIAFRCAIKPAPAARAAAALGVTLALGLLAKATFIPLTIASLVLLARRTGGRHAAIAALTTATLALPWYAYHALSTGFIIPANDAMRLAQGPGLWPGLTAHATAPSLLRMLANLALSFVWQGTWSYVWPPIWCTAPVLACLAALAWQLRRLRRPSPPEALAILTLSLFVAALLAQSLILIASGGVGAPTWYLHAFLPVLAPLLAAALLSASRVSWSCGLLQIQLAVMPPYIVLLAITETAYFAGCAAPVLGGNAISPFATLACFIHPRRLAETLPILAHPTLAAALFAAGFILLCVGVAQALPHLRPHRP
jgi:hypothetical protein